MAPMGLLQLPSEILLHILNHVGASFFHQDPSRLRVSKRWYSLAWLILAQDPHLSLQTLPRLLANEETFGRIQPHVGSVNLVLHFPDKTVRDCANVDDKRVVEANSHLDQLAVLLRHCPQLKALSLVAQVDFFGLSTGSIGSLLSASPLTSLHIDIPIRLALWRGRPGYNDHTAHLCCCINALLPSLRRLRCRMHLICGRLLEPLPDDANGPLKLEELIINFTQSPFTGPGRRDPRSCDSILAPFRPTQQVIEAQAEALAARLPNARMVRVIGYGPRKLRGIYAYNAITKRREMLNFYTEWDASGTVLADENGGSIEG
ncbi:predicted protein [Chaetomium globosum CBS 148.51]|uniref:F-box domain-containing protein n=1 Tax=Chaetomium globosum (strain ATCC 6205 / CBS 148.51 / DSM 1962 / NBRC 6347 / NRRL 1970) TaxID=306901 RepID=Q2HBY0_CHAGB|nr:uncharacterized protein CHGG_02274 [Chaetomium globosum CBS 148.51]EAQ90339.1 predicted protein [Chaetomium globosum CBS 148.51]